MHTVIFCNGTFTCGKFTPALLERADLIIGVDGGSNHLAALNCTPQLILGDLDSISAENLSRFRKAGVSISRYPEDKDATDLELALDLAVDKGSDTITIFGGLGGRWDMSFGNLLLAAAAKYHAVSIDFYTSGFYGRICRPPGPHCFSVEREMTFSLLPLGGEVTGITVRGARYPLTEESLAFGSSRGISNVASGEKVTVSLCTGVLLFVLLTP